jgi:hypothetical protein
MKFLSAVCLISLGGFLETFSGGAGRGMWLLAFAVSGCGWAWYGIGVTAARALTRLRAAVTGRPPALLETDPQALAAEIRALNAQLAQLRDTATSFDMSFDQTLHRLNERLSRLEQQSAYVQAGRNG